MDFNLSYPRNCYRIAPRSKACPHVSIVPELHSPISSVSFHSPIQSGRLEWLNVTPNETQAPPWPGFHTHAVLKEYEICGRDISTIT